MQISELLAFHNSYSVPNMHPDILGDGYLLEKNLIYRNVKLFALKLGCSYAEAWPQYLLLPFHELNDIVATRTIPYVPHARMLKDLEARRPHVLTIEDVPMPESYHLHEAAHVIAAHLFEGVRLSEPRDNILKAIVCESFANAVDALACVPADNDLHRFFIKQNCYMHPIKKNMDILKRLTESLGFRCTFMLTLLAYVHANFMQEKLPTKVIKDVVSRYAPKGKLKEKVLKDCHALGRIGEKLDPLFRVQTTGIYLKLEGYDGDIFKVLNFRFMDIFNKNQEFRKVAESMANVLASETIF